MHSQHPPHSVGATEAQHNGLATTSDAGVQQGLPLLQPTAPSETDQSSSDMQQGEPGLLVCGVASTAHTGNRASQVTALTSSAHACMALGGMPLLIKPFAHTHTHTPSLCSCPRAEQLMHCGLFPLWLQHSCQNPLPPTSTR